jgi:hypothetical protein
MKEEILDIAVPILRTRKEAINLFFVEELIGLITSIG